MTIRSNFGNRTRNATPGFSTDGRAVQRKRVLDLKGLNTELPDEILEDGRSPYLKNARYYAESDEDSRVAISTRKGPGEYTIPIGEALNDDSVVTTGEADKTFTKTTWLADTFTPTASGRLSKVELRLKDDTGTVPVMVKIYSDSSGAPDRLLATSSIDSPSITSSYTYLQARFIAAPKVVSGTAYWIVVHMQDNGTGQHSWASTTATTTALSSTDSGVNWSSTAYSLNWKTYIADSTPIKGQYRLRTSAGTEETILAVDDTLYSVNDTDGVTTSLETGLDTQAEDYYFDKAYDNVYFVNGYDTTKKYIKSSGTVEDVGFSATYKNVISHVNRLFFLRADDDTRIDFTNLGDSEDNIETIESTSFFHVPTPTSGDPVVGYIVFQDNLVIFTRNTKWILYGTDPSTFSLRQAVGKKGAVNQDTIAADESYIYFLSDDGVYRFNGSDDELISDTVSTAIDNIGDKKKASAVVFNRKYRLYYPRSGSGYSNEVLLWDIVYEDWFRDTGVWTTKPIVAQQSKTLRLYEASSLLGASYYANQQYSDLGAPIDFEYRTKYFDMGVIEEDKLLRKLYPLLRAQDEAFDLIIDIDKDYEDNPSSFTVAMQAAGDKWAGGDLWSSTFEYGKDTFSNKTIFANRQGNTFQARFRRVGVSNPIEIIGYTWLYKRTGVR